MIHYLSLPSTAIGPTGPSAYSNTARCASPCIIEQAMVRAMLTELEPAGVRRHDGHRPGIGSHRQ